MHLAALFATDVAATSIFVWFIHRFEISVHAREAASHVSPADGSFGRVLADGEGLKLHDAMQYSTKVDQAPVIENRNFGR